MNFVLKAWTLLAAMIVWFAFGAMYFDFAYEQFGNGPVYWVLVVAHITIAWIYGTFIGRFLFKERTNG